MNDIERALSERIDAQDERIRLLWEYTHEHREIIKSVVEDAARASRAAAAALELLTQVLSKSTK